MSKHRRRGAEVSGGDSSTPLRHTQLINERAHILGLQLQQAALAGRIAAAIRSYGLPTPQQQLHELLLRGVIQEDLASARAEVDALKGLLDRVQSGRLATTSAAAATGTTSRSGTGRQAGGGGSGSAASRAAGSKQYSALAVDHVRHWLDQAQEAVLMLEDLTVPGTIDEWPFDAPEPLPPRAPGGPYVAHFIQRIPPEVAALLELPPASYDQPPLGAPGPCRQALAPTGAEGAAAASTRVSGGGGSGGGGAAILWDAAPLLRDPSPAAAVPGAPWLYRVACHESAEHMWPSLAHGDLVLLLPGRYNWPEGTMLLRSAVRVLGLGRQPSDVVIHNNEEDDIFVECSAGPSPPPPPMQQGGGSSAATLVAAPRGPGKPSAAGCANAAGCSAEEAAGVVFENLTLLQLGGYEGVLRVLRGRTTLVDVVVQFAMGGIQVDSGGHLVLRNVRVAGGATAGLQVAAGGVLEMVSGCEVVRCGAGDDVVPKDLGGVEVMVPFADYPRLAPPSPRALLQAHAELLAPGGLSEGAAAPTARPAPAAALEMLQPHLGAVQSPATVVIGPGCTIQNNRGFAISLVKRRALAAYHELLHSASGGGGGGGGSHASYGGGGGSGSGGGGCSLAAALDGARVFVSRGSLLGPNNSRGAVGVVELEYHQLDGDGVNRRTASRHFHAVQMTARQLQDGFASPGADWTSYRIRLEGQPARPGRKATKIDVAATVAAAATASCSGSGRHGGPTGVVVGSRTLRQLLVTNVTRAQRRQRGLTMRYGDGLGGGDTSEDSTGDDNDDDNSVTSRGSGSSDGRRSNSAGSEGNGGSGSSSDGGTAIATAAASRTGNGGGGGGDLASERVLLPPPPPPRFCACCGWSPRSASTGVTSAVTASDTGVREADTLGAVSEQVVDGGATEPSKVEQQLSEVEGAAVAAVSTTEGGAIAAGPSANGGAGGGTGTCTATTPGSAGGSGDGGDLSCPHVPNSHLLVRSGGTGAVAAAVTLVSAVVTLPDESPAADVSSCSDILDAQTRYVAVSAATSAATANPSAATVITLGADVEGTPQAAAGTATCAAEGTDAATSADNGAVELISSSTSAAGCVVAVAPAAAGTDHRAMKLRRCGGCLAVLYCSEECQRRDWPRHAAMCREKRGMAAAAAATVAADSAVKAAVTCNKVA
ncbi:hypothetical protein Vafri_19907 [Volvox africanus]|uniref:MYND-type domain-containing protein n=1 Tax=Volvox africanus TaxID=51714 RepID=A0A8J4FDD5_9CHLO|nr:hypothetical protein Vafri_19907 [Volvox africanus]